MTTNPRPAAAHHLAHLRRFTAATWNVYHGSPVPVLQPTLHRLLHPSIGASLIFGQEMAQEAHRQMLRDAGLVVAFAPRQYVIAWDPEVWAGDGEPEHVRLSHTAYYAAGGDHQQFSEAVMQRLTHLATGMTLAGMSYHTPAHVQHAEKPPRRITALHESAASWRRLSREALRQEADAVLFAGDDNVDERLGHGAWGFMLRGATGLRQVQAPHGTHGRIRRIDDFRLRGALAVGAGQTLPVPPPDDHDVHVRDFRWK